ncbi:MAG: GNAT family N-acetyltransferase [Phycisphaerales bacterium]|nr:GNAT family N-acetyltransferase [Phycisphaerales bacterium]
MLRGLLAAAGIDAALEGDTPVMGLAGIGRVQVVVDDCDYLAAAKLLAASGLEKPHPTCLICGYDLRGLPEPRCPECGHPFPVARARPLAWTCRHCGEVLDGQFTFCWNCGVEREADGSMTPTSIISLGAGDAARLEEFLQRHLCEAMFLLANSRRAGLVDTGEPLTGAYAAEIIDGEVAGVVAHFWNGMLIPCAPVDRVATLGRAALVASKRPLRGFIGPQAQVEELARAFQIALKEEDGPLPDTVRLDSIEGLYELELGQLEVPGALAAGQVTVRRGREDDLPLLIDWDIRYAFESLGATDLEAQRAISEGYQRRFVADGHIFLLFADGKPVARALYNAAIREAVQIGGVWTVPELRGRRYARAVVAGALLAAREQGVERAILFTEHTNTPARRAYDALGFQRVGDFRLLFLK